VKLAVWSYLSPAHVGASKAASSFNRIHTIVRAPKGDGYGTIMLAMFERLGVSPPLTISALTEATLAGDRADIGRMIADVDGRLHPEMIVITRSATASVLQEPLDGEIAMIPPGTIAAEIFQPSVHPLRDNEITAFAKTVAEIVDHFAQDGVARTPEPSVNIIGPALLGFHDHSNVVSLRRLFADLGVRVNAVVPLGAAPDQLRALGSAWLNVCTARELALPTMKQLQARFGTPFIEDVPYGEAGTTRFLRQVCALLELPHDRIVAASREAKLLWYARTVDAHALSGKRVGVFGMPSAVAGIARVLHDELDMHVEFAGTFSLDDGAWLREQLRDLTDDVLVTDDYQDVANKIDATRPDIMFGSQMERHSASRFGVPCAVISSPCHILNFPLGHAPFLGYEGANHIGDVVNQTQVLGLEHHLIETFGPRGQGRFAEAAPEGAAEPAAPVSTDLTWDETAERLMGRIPFFVRKKARANIEKYAREQRLATIDESVVLAARQHVGG
jgi:light-independent protochlorophyllide reductase subunit B